ncbi:MAG: DUF4176 domain-containing protein [Lachnospiraceae bacterium]|nr:DUF4176 domain-containing protein [Lachnospiraceae bacterium]
MEHILPIGSVVEAHNVKLCLLGARMVEKDGHMALAYVAVKYPRGFAGKESLGVVLASDIKQVLFEGNEGKTGKKFNEGLLQTYQALEGKTPEEANVMMDQIKDGLRKARMESM